MAQSNQPFWVATYNEAKRAYKEAEHALTRMAGRGVGGEERFQAAGYGRSCVLYAILVNDIEKGLRIGNNEKVKIYKRAAMAFGCGGQLGMAWNCLDKWLSIHPAKTDEYYFVQGFLQYRARDYEQAVICFNKSLRLYDASNTTTAYILSQKAAALFAQGHIEQARACAAEAVHIAPKKAVLWEVYMEASKAMGDHKQAHRARLRIQALLSK